MNRPVTAQALFESPEMALRYPGEIELRRDGTDEGKGRGFDNADLSAAAARSIAAADPAATVVSWFVDGLAPLGWTEGSSGWFKRGEGESLVLRVERDCGHSRMSSAIRSAEGREIQEKFEERYYAGAPEEWTVVTLFYLVAPQTINENARMIG